MSFVQPAFPLFLAVVLGVWWAMPWRRARIAWLVLVSAVFYGWVHWWYLGLLAFSTLLDFGVGLGMARWPKRKRLLLGLSLAGNLGVLGFFKYAGFFVENVSAVLQAVGLHPGLPVLEVMLPVGISFFTFQTMSYTIDVYRGKLEPSRDLLEYAAFVCMFPQLVAGPVERARNLLPQLRELRAWDTERFASGLGLACWGAFQKVVVADTLGLYVDRALALDDAPATLVWAATLGFAFQILADFSGYTDIARGTARMLGFELMENFARPYLARSPSEFWQRWHMSFSSWIHEYLYIPLGGSRHGELRRIGATYGALLLSGLWHGAAWHFVVWGAYHATLLTLWRHLGRVIPDVQGRAADTARIGLMFLCTVLGWLIFRAPDLPTLVRWLTLNPLQTTWEHHIATLVVLSLAVAGGLVLGGGAWVRRTLGTRLVQAPSGPVLRAAGWSLLLVFVVLFSRDTAHDFIYFRF